VVLGALKDAKKPLYIDDSGTKMLSRIKQIEETRNKHRQVAEILREVVLRSLRLNTDPDIKSRIENLALHLNTLSYRLSYDREDILKLNKDLFYGKTSILDISRYDERLKTLKAFLDQEIKKKVPPAEAKFLARSKRVKRPLRVLIEGEKAHSSLLKELTRSPALSAA
jgi:hypothetical protein